MPAEKEHIRQIMKMTKEEPDFKNKNIPEILWHYARPHRKLFYLDMLCAVIVSAIDLAYPYVSRIAMYNWLPESLYKTFFIAMAIIAAAYVLKGILLYIVTFWGHCFGIRVEADIRQDLFAHIQTMSYSFFNSNRTGMLMSRMTTDLFEISEMSHHCPEDFLISGLTITGSVIMMFTIEWRLALLLSLLLPVFIFCLIKARLAWQNASLEVKKKTGAINNDIEQGLSGIKTGKAFANEKAEYDKFSISNDAFKTSKLAFHKAMARFNSTMEFFCSILSVAVMSFGGFLIMKGEMNYIDLLTFTLYISSFTTPLRKVATSAETLSGGMAGMQRFLELMRTEPDIQDAPDAKPIKVNSGEIKLTDVSFSYEDDEEVLCGIDMDIKGGETIAVVGSSGGGKTTLCHLIPRFFDVKSGSIEIDGQDVRAVTQASLRKKIGIVQQDVFLFAGSIMENIRYGRPDASDREVFEAAIKAEIYNDIMDMPQQFNTYVGERGALLSGGQKQRIAIARIFLKNPPILILDEATSALDSITESHIQNAFDELSEGRTTLIIAHRLSTIRKADRIIVIDDGIIKEEGSHLELLLKGGIYKELWDSQNKLI